MNIAIEAINIRDGGGLRHLNEILVNIDKEILNNDKIFVWVNKSLKNRINFNSLNTEIIYINSFSSNVLIVFLSKLLFFKSQLIKKKCDVLLVSSNYYFFSPIPTVLIVQNLLPIHSYKISFFNFFFYFKNTLLALLIKKSILKSSGIIFLSYASKEIIFKKFKLKKNINYKVIYHGVSKKFFLYKSKYLKNLAIKDDYYKILYVSKLDDYKNHLNLIKSIKLLVIQGLKIKLFLIGPYSILKSFRILLSIKLNNYPVKFIYIKGEMTDGYIAKYYSICDLHCFVSSSETFGIILAEGMSVGIPAVCNNSKVFKEICKDSAIYVNANNYSELAKCIKNVILDNELKKKLSKKAREFSKNFLWKNTSKDTFNYVKSFFPNKI
jgi:glycosyltransferase involved in cell wall biosynthesis